MFTGLDSFADCGLKNIFPNFHPSFEPVLHRGSLLWKRKCWTQANHLLKTRHCMYAVFTYIYPILHPNYPNVGINFTKGDYPNARKGAKGT